LENKGDDMKTLVKIVLLLCVLITVSCAKEHMIVLTEEFPPYNFTLDGEVVGLSTEVITAILSEAGISYEFQVHPWKESYDTALSTKNCMLFSTSRLESREDLFKWVGTISPADYSVFALAGKDIDLPTLENLKDYKIGITQGDAREAYFQSKGFVVGKQLIVAENNAANLKKLINKEIDLWPMPDAVANYTAQDAGYKSEEIIEIAFALKDLTKDGYYLAVNKSTPDSIVMKLQAALDKLKADGTYDKILKKWGI